MSLKSFKAESRIDWHQEVVAGKVLSDDRIKLGALLRIADATEAMAKNYNQLVSERDRAVAAKNLAFSRERKLERRVAALRGIISRMKRIAGLKKQA